MTDYLQGKREEMEENLEKHKAASGGYDSPKRDDEEKEQVVQVEDL